MDGAAGAVNPIPYGRQWITEEDVEAVAQVLRSGWITQGPRIEAFEKALVDTTGAHYAVACSSGTAALHLICLALGLNEEDVVVTTPLTFLATANAARFVGARVVFCDIDPLTFNLDPNRFETIAKKATGRKKVVIPVHFAGLPCNMERIRTLAENDGWLVIEDGCHALGASYDAGSGNPVKVGSCTHSVMTAFSFHPVKSITTAEGGAVTTNDPELVQRLKQFRNHGTVREPERFQHPELGFDRGVPNPWYYEMTELGYNYRMTDLQAALGRSQLQRLPSFLQRREEIVSRYREAFDENPLLDFQVIPAGVVSANHLFVLLIDFEKLGKSRRQVMEGLRTRGVLTQVHYLPLHLQPYYQQELGTKPGDFPNAEAYYKKALSIPLFPAMSDENVDTVIQAVNEIVKAKDDG